MEIMIRDELLQAGCPGADCSSFCIGNCYPIWSLAAGSSVAWGRLDAASAL